MDSISARKSTRAAAARRRAVVDSSDDDDENRAPQPQEDEEEAYTPAPAPVKRARGRPRKTGDAIPSVPSIIPRRRTRASESVEPSRQTSPSNAGAEPSSPKRRRGRLRKTQANPAIERSREEDSILPTPQLSASPTTPSVVSASATEIASPLAQSRSPQSQRMTSPLAATASTSAMAPISSPSAPASSPRPQLPSAPPTPSVETLDPTGLDDTITPTTPRRPPASPSDATPGPTPLPMTATRRPEDIVVRQRPALREPARPQKRIVITHLILTNFKSYAGKQVVGPFHASFSSVVGPNGSGKSNVIDSLLFVFGFRASKMRQGKISALIHNSAAFPDLDHCEVQVHFEEVMDQPDGRPPAVISDSKLIISRRAFKNNSSKYYMNGRESTFTDVTGLLRARGIDLDHKRFLILQGEVESIAQMKAKAGNEHEDGLLEYLEDVIGTSKYKTPIEESAAKFEELNEICMEKSSRVKHVEKEKSGLEDKKNKALAYIRDENELACKKATLYQVLMSDIADHLQVTQEAVTQLEAELNEELERHQGNKESIKQLEKKYKQASKEHEAFSKQSENIMKEAARIEKETVKFEEKKKFLLGKQKKLEKNKESSRLGMTEGETLVTQYTDDIARYTSEIADLEKQMKAEEKELESIRAGLAGKTQGLSDQIAAKQSSLEPWRAKVNEKQSAMAVAQSELDILREKENAGANAIAEVEEKIASMQESKASKEAELDECKAERKRVEKEAQKVQARLDALSEKEPALRAKLSGARQKADEARASLSATQSQDNVLTGLMRMRDSGRINGFHGKLGNLGTIDQNYDVAISTACPQLSNMVVDTVEVGQQCIDHLRKNNLGRANFILMDRLAKRDLSRIDTPENAPRLFDLVKPKHDRFRPAFFSVLQNTLVAKNLEQANRIAYGATRWRVVTLDGQLIDKSGTMSGGGTRVAKGGMSSKLVADVTKEQVVKFEHDRDSLEQDFEQYQHQYRQLETTLRELNENIPQLETTAQKLALELSSFDRNIADAQRRIKELGAEQSTAKSDKGRISALEKTITGMEKEISKLRDETADVEGEIKDLRDKIMEIGGVKLRSQKAKVDGLKQQIDTLSEAMSSSEVSRSKEEKKLAKNRKMYNEAATELDKLAADFETVEEDMQAHKRDAAGITQQAEQTQEALDERTEQLQALKKELDEKTAEFNEARAVEIEMRNKLDESQKSLNEYVKKQRHLEEKMSKLSYQSLSDLGESPDSEGLPTYTKDELQDMDKAELQSEIADLEKRNQNASVDLTVLEEYRRRSEEHAARSLDLAEALEKRDAEKKHCDELRSRRLEGFKEGFDIINEQLKHMYRMITMGGNAMLELVDSLDPFTEGIHFSVMPPKKTWKNIANLSGGEKTLSSLALVFALHHYKPTPLYVMDEIDAALDFKNVSIVAAYIKERTQNAQFIVISLRNNMFELASRLVGVYKVNQMTKSVTLENKDYLRDGAAA
ncbi:RecF/RecN/SMC protein [Sporormia fimetaria CBS 119925]|uniref:Structural maintenance of chromosomes protein n=1 Tax=Sporormia fimetaria CBS 119925 TaxID=1340428 RepID=A0A6A6VR05_9PLEO|nr:RecF/RecN/SMC protein [Sporormia fimetaria CBS 119925]